MSEARNTWLGIIREIMQEFRAVDMAPGDRTRLNQLYPELQAALVDPATGRDPQADLYRKAGISLVEIDPNQEPDGRSLGRLRDFLSGAARSTAQEAMSQEAKFELLKRIASAKSRCQRMLEALPPVEEPAPEPAPPVWAEAAAESEPEVEPLRPPSEAAAVGPETGEAVPVQARERIALVDILRGFALIGVLVANMAGFAGMAGEVSSYEGLDRIIVILIRFLVQAKFYSLFSLLFGWGMAIQLSRAEARGVQFLPVYLRRLLILLIMGVIHGALIWNGDILTIYALLGFVLLLFRKRSPKFVLAAAGLFLLSSFVLEIPGETMDAVREWYWNLTAFMRPNRYPESLYATGDYLAITRLRVEGYIAMLSWLPFFGNIVAMFLLGLYIGKRGIFRQVDQHLPLLRRVAWGGLIIGAILNGVFAWTTIDPSWAPAGYDRFIGVGSRILGAPALMLFYVTGIILLVRKNAWYERLAPLAALGRSALSNYLLQSVVCTLLFYNYGLGFYGQARPTVGLILTIVVLAIQIRLSEWWFDNHQFGPMEWVWRLLTYGKLAPGREKGEESGRRRLGERVNLRIALPLLGLALAAGAVGGGYWLVTSQDGGGSEALRPAEPVSSPQPRPGSSQSAGAEDEAFVIVTPAVQPVVYAPGPIARSGDLEALALTFDEEQAYALVEELAGSLYQGRATGSRGGWAAGESIAELMAAYGLQPAGDEGDFFQAFEVPVMALAKEPSLVVEGADGTVYRQFKAYQDFTALVGAYLGAGQAEGEVVWVNNCSHDDFGQADVLDRVVLCRDPSTGVTGAEEITILGRNALEHGAVGLLLLADPEILPADLGQEILEAWVPVPLPALRIYPPVAEALLQGSGRSLSDLSLSFFSFPLKSWASLAVSTQAASACPAGDCQGRNVLGVLPGRDPAYADQIVIVGAHYDHLGASPSGLVWPGANNDASGVAVMLEIARHWQEQGYVPRRTVLFAAWDAGELEMQGSTHYVSQPRYPMDAIVAMIQLDQVGAGGESLVVGGDEALKKLILASSQALQVEAESSSAMTSDHRPFLDVRVPACVLSWAPEASSPTSGRPEDTPATIDPGKLRSAGQVVEVALLGLTEGELEIQELLDRRAEAVMAGALEDFLVGVHPDQTDLEQRWFEAVQALSPTQLRIEIREIQVAGREAAATVRMVISYPSETGSNSSQTRSLSLPVRFMHNGDDWQWAGPNLVPADSNETLTVMAPASQVDSLRGLAQEAARQYRQAAELLGRPTNQGAILQLFATGEALRAGTSPSMLPNQDSYVGPGTIRLVYGEEISSSLRLRNALVQLVLADAGVTEESAPWLWEGLPLAIRDWEDPLAVQAALLPRLQKELTDRQGVDKQATAWAAVTYLEQGLGWRGIGEVVATLGAACQEGQCQDPAARDQALTQALGMNLAGLEQVWRGHWQERLNTAQSRLDALLARRERAVLAGDQAAFLATVDPQVPNLLAEQEAWLAAWAAHPLDSFSLSGALEALLEDGSLLADVTVSYSGPSQANPLSFSVLFTASGEKLLWAGVPQESLEQNQVMVRYPAGEEETARAVLAEAESIYRGLGTTLGSETGEALTIKLYREGSEYRGSISPVLPSQSWLTGWTAAGESIKLQMTAEATPESYRSNLATLISRHLLYQMGVEAEWLIKGGSIYLARPWDGGLAEQGATSQLNQVLRQIKQDELGTLAEMPPDMMLSEETLNIAQAQAWDAVRFLVYRYGSEALTGLLGELAQGTALEAALQEQTGLDLARFEAAWRESFARGHVQPEWVETALAFDPERAYQEVEVLAAPELAGRAAGSPGARMAAAQIAEQFAAYGLQPAGGEDDFLQRFPISYTTYLSQPSVEILGPEGQDPTSFAFREEFSPLLNEISSRASVEGELVWVRDALYQGLDLTGKVVLCRPSDGIGENYELAREQGAAGLIVIGEVENKKQYLAKQPIPVRYPSEETIPVLELTQAGYTHLLERIGLTPPELFGSPPALPLGVQVRIEIPISTPETVASANVLGLLPGSDPALSQELVILGAHYDYVGDDPENRTYSGGNDNASGVAVMLEIARLWQETGYRPARSVLFAAWGAQELGMLGSRYYVAHPVHPLEQTIAMLQMDAVGGGGGHYMEVQGFQEQEGLLRFDMQVAEDLVDGRLKLAVPSEVASMYSGSAGPELYLSPFEGVANQLLNARPSDQMPFHAAGIPAVLITWRGANEDNWPDEIADEVEPYRLEVTGRMVTLVMMNLAR